MRGSRDRLVLFVLLVVTTFTVQGYTIRPFADVHESMTRAAALCTEQASWSGSEPSQCYPLMERPLTVVDVLARLLRRIGVANYPVLEEAVRWPDIPAGANAGSLLDLLVRCERRIEKRGGGVAHINNGLLCNSHYGSMQFFHAQATAAGEPAEVTRAKIMAWGELLFDVATDRRDDRLDTPYCDVFDGPGLLDEAMRPEEDAVPCMTGPDGPWLLSDLFTMECRNPFDPGSCAVRRGPRAREIARTNATGALLHLIQDSYSQSHAQRGDVRVVTGGAMVAEVVCRPIRQFTSYVVQNEDRHGEADGPPSLHPSCDGSSRIDDAVTASAKALRHIDAVRAATDPGEVRRRRAMFLHDLGRVFTLEEDARPAGAGDCCWQR